MTVNGKKSFFYTDFSKYRLISNCWNSLPMPFKPNSCLQVTASHSNSVLFNIHHYLSVSLIFHCRHFTVMWVANVYWGILQAISSYHTSLLVTLFYQYFIFLQQYFCKVYAFLFSVNKLWHHIDVIVKLYTT